MEVSASAAVGAPAAATAGDGWHARLELGFDESKAVELIEKAQRIYAANPGSDFPWGTSKERRLERVFRGLLMDAEAAKKISVEDADVLREQLSFDRQQSKKLRASFCYAVKIGVFRWGFSGRATTLGRNDGLTKVIVDPVTDQVLGVGLVGAGAGELIAEAVVAIEMGATAKDLAMCIHAHPTLSETIGEAAEMLHGLSSHVFVPKKKPE